MKRKQVGDKFGRLTLVEKFRFFEKNNWVIYWKCKCDCGNVKIARAKDLSKGDTKSCGCYNKDKSSERKLKHGESLNGETKEYKAWQNMKTRCFNINNKDYRHYGGRGITVCKRWLESYENFLSDIGRSPSEKHSIDRINNDGNYEPSNCRWATTIEQANNKRKNVFNSL